MKAFKHAQPNEAAGTYDTSTNDQFYDYYREQSVSTETQERFERLVDLLMKTMAERGESGPFKIADIGGGAGTLARIFSRAGHKVTCVDISKDLLEVGRSRFGQ